jgi:hypothetical protein
MASVPESISLDLKEQIARIDRGIAETGKLQEETRKFVAEAHKLSAEQTKFQRDRTLSPWLLLAQGLIAGAALLGAGIALAKMLLAQ